MRKLGLLILLVSVSGCQTISNWTHSTMAWADRTMPTYDDVFGDGKKDELADQNVTQRTPVPVEPVQATNTTPSQPTLNTQQEMYYDNSERGHSFLGSTN